MSFRFVGWDNCVGRKVVTVAEANKLNAAILKEGSEDMGTWQDVKQFCCDCGQVNERKGHMGCQFPND